MRGKLWFGSVLVLALANTACLAGSGDVDRDRFVRWQTDRILHKEAFEENLVTLKKNAPLQFGRIAHLVASEGLRSPLFMDGKRVAFIQPDGTFTLIELETGRVVARTRATLNLRLLGMGTKALRLAAEEWIVDNNVLVGADYRNDYIFRIDTGELLDFRYQKPIRIPGLIVNPSFRTVEIIDTGTLARTEHDIQIPRGKAGTSQNAAEEDRYNQLDMIEREMTAVLDGRLYFAALNRNQKRLALQCRTLPDFQLQWTLSGVGNEDVLGFALVSGQVHVFFGPRESEGSGGVDRCTTVRVYDAGGEELRQIPVLSDLFAGMGSTGRFSGYYTYNGVDYYGANIAAPFRFPLFCPAEQRPEPDLLAKVSSFLEGRQRVLSVIPLSGGGLAWIALQGNDDGVDLVCHDATASWKGAIRTTEDWLEYEKAARPGWGHTAFLLAANDEFIIYASRSGKMECIERSSGKSRWIYVFSAAPLPAHHTIAGKFIGYDVPRLMQQKSVFSWGPFFSDLQELYRQGVSTADVLPLLVAVANGSTTVPVIVDPEPDIKHEDEIHDMGIVLLVVPLASLTAILLLRFLMFKHYLAGLAIMLAVNFSLYYRYGGYSRTTAGLLLTVVIVLILSLGFGKKLCKG